MSGRRALTLLVVALVACAAGVSEAATSAHHRAGSVRGDAPAAQASGLRVAPLLPFARGQLVVSLGDPPSWQPVAGEPLTVTLFSGRPGSRRAAALNAYIGFQSVDRGCPSAATGDRGHLLTVDGYYHSQDRVTGSSSFTPGGGAAAGDYEASIPDVVVHGARTVRACVWLSSSPRRRTRATVQDVPLLTGLFAASVANVPSAVKGSGDAYTLNAVYVARRFAYSVATLECGKRYRSATRQVAPGALATESVSFLASPCASDTSQINFSAAGQRSLGALSYSPAQATTVPPTVTALGACELDPVTVTHLADAVAYVQADGCSVGNLLAAPFRSGIPRGAVIEAQVDGGIAEVAPKGTAVDLVLNGRP